MSKNKDFRKEENPIGIVFEYNGLKNNDYLYTYDNKDFTYKGELKKYDYNKILKDKQSFIYQFMELASYYVDADDIFSGIIKRVLVPFSLSCGFSLVGISEVVKKKYIDFLRMISFLDTLKSIFFELYTFGNCYTYCMPSGQLITLPPHRMRISDIMVKGEPICELNIVELNNYRRSGAVKEDFLKTLQKKYDGYPPEIRESLKKGDATWVQLDPQNTFVIQESKPMWQKYAIPFISTCLKALSKKELISYYEDTQLNMGSKSFLHVTIGDNEHMLTPTKSQLDMLAAIFQNALNKFPLAVTNHMVKADWKTIDQSGLFDNSKYYEVNSQILNAGGISTVIVTGDSKESSFANVNVSVETAAQRITQNQENVAEAINKYFKRLNEIDNGVKYKIPELRFNQVNLTNNGEIKAEAIDLWQRGNLSRRTLLEKNKYDYDQEKQRKKEEKADDEIFATPINPFTTTSTDGNNDTGNSSGGRPTKNPKDLKRDKNNSDSGKSPKPSSK